MAGDAEHHDCGDQRENNNDSPIQRTFPARSVEQFVISQAIVSHRQFPGRSTSQDRPICSGADYGYRMEVSRCCFMASEIKR
jgi:hypothetical protein